MVRVPSRELEAFLSFYVFAWMYVYIRICCCMAGQCMPWAFKGGPTFLWSTMRIIWVMWPSLRGWALGPFNHRPWFGFICLDCILFFVFFVCTFLFHFLFILCALIYSLSTNIFCFTKIAENSKKENLNKWNCHIKCIFGTSLVKYSYSCCVFHA